MEFRKVLVLRGPNMWANFPVIEAWVDLGVLKDSPSDELPGFNERLMSWLPTMIEHRCSIGERGGFFERLRRGTYQAHILEHVTLELQELIGMPVGYGRAREMDEDGVYKVVVEYEEEEVGIACLYEARELCLAAVYDRPYDVRAAVDKLRKLALKVKLGPSTNAIVEAARARKIPYRRLNSQSLVQFGHGVKQRRILTAETDRTGAIAEGIAQDKDLTRILLRAVGVPMPEGRPVESAEDAWEAALEIGVPVVVKPRYGNQGKGVATNLRTKEQVVAAYEQTREDYDYIIVEKFHVGSDYRVLVVGDKVVAAARREPAQVVGDGTSTIRELIDRVNQDPRRGDDHETSLSKIKIDPIAFAVLTEQGYTPESVPASGARVLIRRNANLSTGGTATDVTDLVHPEVAARSIDAARAVGLDIAGIDIIAEEISRPLEDQGGVVVEVNAGPGLRMHLEPSVGIARPVGEAIVATLYPPGDNGRVPIAAVTGVNGKTTVTRLIGHILRKTGRTIGMTCSDGIYIDDRRIEAGDCSGPKSARSVLLHPRVEAAVFETARGGILREGTGFDHCDVAVVTNIADGDHLGISGIETLEKLALVKRTIVDIVLPEGTAVLNAQDPLVVEMAPHCKGSVLFWALSETNPILAEHRSQGKRVAFIRDEQIILAEGSSEITLVPLSRIPLTHHGRIGFQVENVLAAVAAAWTLGVPLDEIRAGLSSFTSSTQQAPGRFNVLESNGSTVVIDYGHNPAALRAQFAALETIPHQRRKIIYSAEGDRRDVDILTQGEMIAEFFDSVSIYEYEYLRGREKGGVLKLLQQGLSKGGRLSETIVEPNEAEAITNALKLLAPGDLLIIQPKEIDDVIRQVHSFLEDKSTTILPHQPSPIIVESGVGVPVRTAD
ncbi:MAG: cyanophycin synthetase [Isosphaeraceae bacterium]